MGEAEQALGWFGKLPSHGDFLVRRLPPGVRLCFDNWLQEGLAQSRADLGRAWLEAWLSSPLWRFMISPDVCGAHAWAGVMMPSHDRVGRCFPLLLASPVNGMPSLRDCLTLHAAWFERIEDAALSTLEAAFSLERFDAALGAIEGAPQAALPSDRGCVLPGAQAPAGGSVAALTGGTLPALAIEAMEGHSAWWTDGSSQVAPCLAVCRDLPAARAFAGMLDGRWSAHGWGRR